VSAKTRIWIMGTALICGALVMLGVLGGLLPQLTAAAATNLQADSQVQVNDTQRTQLSRFQQAEETLDELSAELEELRKALPATAASADWVGQLRRFEESSGARVTGFLVKAPISEESGSVQQAPAAEGPDQQPGDDQASAVALIPIPVSIEVAAPELSSAASFMRSLQIGERLFVVKSVEILFEENASDPEMPWKARAHGILYTVPEN